MGANFPFGTYSGVHAAFPWHSWCAQTSEVLMTMPSTTKGRTSLRLKGDAAAVGDHPLDIGKGELATMTTRQESQIGGRLLHCIG